MDSNSIDNTSFSSDKSETQKYINPVEFAKTIDIASADYYNSISVTEPAIKYPDITDFDSFEAIKYAIDTAATLDDQQLLSYVLPLILDKSTERYKLPDYAEDLYH